MGKSGMDLKTPDTDLNSPFNLSQRPYQFLYFVDIKNYLIFQ